MSEFSFVQALDLKDALAVLDRERGRALPVAGTTNVMPALRSGLYQDKLFLGIRNLEQLRGIRYSRGKIAVGALEKLSDIAASQLLLKKAPALYMAANVFADATTRNSATLGGNLAFASPAADSAPPLLALKANILLQSKNGRRRLPLAEFFSGVNKTVLADNELILGVEFAANPHSAFYKLGLRNAMAISVATAAASLRRDKSGCITEAVIAMGAVAPTPLRLIATEQAVLGKSLADLDKPEMIRLLAKAVNSDISPIDDIRASAEYRREVAPVLVRRTLTRAGSLAPAEGRE